MKKRKFPVGLVIALVVLLGGAGAYSVYNTTVANRSPEETARIMQEEAMKEAMKNAPPPSTDQESPDKESVRSQVVGAASRKPAAERGPGSGGPEGAAPAPGSSIMAPKPAPYKPVPNESATSSQWFQKK